jgi:hypothetical protein
VFPQMVLELMKQLKTRMKTMKSLVNSMTLKLVGV